MAERDRGLPESETAVLQPGVLTLSAAFRLFTDQNGYLPKIVVAEKKA